MTKTTRTVQPRRLAITVVCIVLNLGLGWLVSSLKLPFYLDSIGTVLATALGGLGVGVTVGLMSVIIGSLYVPTLWAYALTAIAIALYTHYARRAMFLERILPTVVCGLVLGVVTALLSAPITALVWGGVSLTGTDALTAFFSVTGQTLLDSVVLAGLSADPIDKLLTALVAFAVLRRLPDELRGAGHSQIGAP